MYATPRGLSIDADDHDRDRREGKQDSTDAPAVVDIPMAEER
jgi:hypothetical protein